MLPLPYVQFEAQKGGMLLYERPVYNEKLQQDIDLEGKRGLNALWFKGAAGIGALCRPSDASRFLVSLRTRSDTSIYLVARRAGQVAA